MAEIILIAVLAVLAVLVVVSVALLARQPIAPPVRNLLVGLALVEIALLVLHTTTWADAQITGFWDWFFDLDKEFTLGTLFSSAQFVLIGLVAWVNAARSSQRIPRLYWALLGAGFIFLGIDEYFIIHERIFEGLGLPGEWWRYLYAGGGGVLLLLSIYVYWRWLRQETRTFVLLFIGLGVMGLSGVALEKLVWNARCPGVDACFDQLLVLEETLEVVGVTIALAGLLVYRRMTSTPSLRGPLVGSGLWAVALIVYLWGLPVLEARTIAEPLSVKFLDGGLELVGYRLSDQTIDPGAALGVTLYWQAHAPLPENYNQSVRLFTRPDAQQVAQIDLEALDVEHVPSRAWLPGTVMRSHVQLDVPVTLSTPASYWLGVRLWHGDWQDTRGVEISETTNRLLTPDVVAVASLAAAGPAPDTPVNTEVNYTFADGFQLTGYTLPESAADTLTVTFQWQAQRDVERDLTQFVHALNADGEQVFGYDQPPFNGRFPTEDWPAGMQVQDTWQIPVPEDVPPGDYLIYTGLYDPQTIQRSAVTGADDQPVPDNLISLGTVAVEG